ncbi:MAG: TRAP transporter large permease [Nitrospinota bacterium]
MTALLALALPLAAGIGAPLFAVIGGAALLGFWAAGENPAVVIVELYRMAEAPTLLAIPLFTFAGYLLAESGAPRRLLRLARAAVGWMPGGLAGVTLLACALFTAFTGASGATIVALGGLLYPLLLRGGCGERFTLGLLTTGGSLGLLFPPSLPLILYALVARVEVDRLFLAGVVPGLLLLLVLWGYSLACGREAAPARAPFSLRELGAAAREAAWELPLPVLILGGIYGGFFTATEAAAIAAFYALVVEVGVYRDLSLARDVPRLMRESMVLVGVILIILGAALGFTNYLVDQEVPMRLLAAMRRWLESPWAFLLALNLFLLAVGSLMDIFSAIIVVVPLILPLARVFGVDPIHLGVIFLTNLEIGYSTPPVGLNLFIASNRFKKPIAELYRASLPFLGLRLAALLLITFVPALSLTLVRWVAGG